MNAIEKYMKKDDVAADLPSEDEGMINLSNLHHICCYIKEELMLIMETHSYCQLGSSAWVF